MGWNIVYQFRKAQNEVDRYLKIVPLITLVDNARVRERLEDIEKDQREYTLDEEHQKLQTAILHGEPSKHETMVLKKTLSSSYPNMGFNEILKKLNEKLQRELQLSQANMDVNQVEVIQSLIDVTETVAAGPLPAESSPKKVSKKVERNYSDADNEKHYSYNEHSPKKKHIFSFIMTGSTVKKGLYQHEEWHTDLLGCCSEPLLWFIDDFLSHLMCCCCALVQEWQEVEIRGIYGPEKTKTSPPPSQFMESYIHNDLMKARFCCWLEIHQIRKARIEVTASCHCHIKTCIENASAP